MPSDVLNTPAIKPEFKINNPVTTLPCFYKWIAPFFSTNCGGCAVPGIYHHIFGQSVKPAANALLQYFKTAAGQVGTANAAFKQYITANNKTLC